LCALAAGFSAGTPGRAQTIEWIRQFGTSLHEFTHGVAVDATGVYVVGQSFGTLPGQTSGGNADSYIRKYDHDGNELWTRQFGTSGNDETARAAASDGVKVYVAGYTNGVFPGQTAPIGGQFSKSSFLRKYDVNGTEQWTRQYSSESGTTNTSIATGVVADASGVYVAGYGGVLPGGTAAGGFDLYVRKYDHDGNVVWTRQFGSNGSDVGQSAALDATGIYFVGHAGTALPGQTSAGGIDAFVRKYNLDGGDAWTRQFGTANEDRAQGVAVSDTAVYVGGTVLFGAALPGQTSFGAHDAFIRKYDANGAEQWTRQFGTTANDQGFSVAADASGVYVSGTTDGAFPGNSQLGVGDAFIRKYDVNGNELWTRQFGTPGPDNAKSLRRGEAALYAAGDSFGNFAGLPPRVGLTDAFVTKVALPTRPVVFEGGIVNNASFAPSPTPVAPGSIAAVFGSNLNDGSTVLFSEFAGDGKLARTLGGSSVTLNGVAAPLFYSTPGQLGIQIPFEMAGQTSATILVTVGGETSAPQTVFLDAFGPGVFTANQQGTGIAAVLHQDGVTSVTEQNPARPNEVLVFFVTGLGTLNPPLETGERSTGNTTVTAATATVDGIAAAVEFSGTAPGFVGLNQVNIRIPGSTRTSTNIPVVLRIGGKQGNTVTIPVAP
jgi:uncharacterized protein (TIGR03437 family)